MSIKIDSSFSFNAIHPRSINSRKLLFNKYNSSLSDAINLKNIPIFLDTNLLLYAYKISTKSKDKLLKYFTTHKKSIYCTKQVQEEFLNNRENVLSQDFLTALKKLPDNFTSEIITPIISFLNKNKDILHDYEFLQTGLKKIKEESQDLHKVLKNEVNNILKSNSNIKFEDEVLDIYSQLNSVNNLDDDEIDFLKKQFDSLKESSLIFPGKKDIKQKSEDPYGDFLIFHEMMKFASIEKTDIIFLTLDFKKDWFDYEGQERKPYIHYLEIFFQNTEQIIYILDAKRALSEILKDPLEDTTQNLEKKPPITPRQNPFSRTLNKVTLRNLSEKTTVGKEITKYYEDDLDHFSILPFDEIEDSIYLDGLLYICNKLNLKSIPSLVRYLRLKLDFAEPFFLNLKTISMSTSGSWSAPKLFFVLIFFAGISNQVDELASFGFHEETLSNIKDAALKAIEEG